jgi:hypothetical protein
MWFMQKLLQRHRNEKSSLADCKREVESMNPNKYCEGCGGLLEETNYKRWNEYFIVQKDSWQCQRCGKTSEAVRK